MIADRAKLQPNVVGRLNNTEQWFVIDSARTPPLRRNSGSAICAPNQ
jgi:hypothetical protein